MSTQLHQTGEQEGRNVTHVSREQSTPKRKKNIFRSPSNTSFMPSSSYAGWPQGASCRRTLEKKPAALSEPAKAVPASTVGYMQIILSINTTADQKGRGIYSLRVSRRTRPRGSATLKEQDIKEHMPRSHSWTYRVLFTYTALLQRILEIHHIIIYHSYQKE